MRVAKGQAHGNLLDRHSGVHQHVARNLHLSLENIIIRRLMIRLLKNACEIGTADIKSFRNELEAKRLAKMKINIIPYLFIQRFFQDLRAFGFAHKSDQLMKGQG